MAQLLRTIVCTLMREREREGVDLAEWGSGDDLQGSRGEETRTRI